MTSRITISRAGHALGLDGDRIPTVTTIIGNSTPKPALLWWSARKAAEWAATHRDLLDAIGEDEWIDQAAGAHNRERNKAALRGTDVHRYAEGLLSGEPIEIPDEHLAITRQAVDFMDAWRVQPIASERPCVNLEHRYGGTFDLIAKLADDKTWLLDWKTGKGPFAEQTLQLAAYAGCDIYRDADGNDQPMPEIDRLGFVMLSDDGWDLVPVVGDTLRLFNVFTRMIGVSTFVQWTTPNRDGVARWPVLGEPVLPASS
jgi:hypothetical protein